MNKCPRCQKEIGSTTYKYCPYCGVGFENLTEYGWIDGYWIGSGT